MKYEPKVLIGTPIYSKKLYCLDKHLRHVSNINYDNCEQVFFENSKSDKHYYNLKSKGLKVVNVPRGNNSRDAIRNSMNAMRQYVEEHGYDYVLVLESDLFPDKELINRLMSHDKEVVGSYYLIGLDKDEEKYRKAMKEFQKNYITEREFRKKVGGLFIKVPCLFVEETKQDTGFKGTRTIGRQEGFEMFNTGLRKVHGCGLGATLISRRIFLRFPFYYDSRMGKKHPDVYFYSDLSDNNIPVYVDTSINIPHEPSDWNKIKDR